MSESWRTDRRKTAERGYGGRWQKARARYLAKHPFCVMCVKRHQLVATTMAEMILECAARFLPVPTATVVDHIVPHQGDQKLFWDQTNWQPLCDSCHSGDKQRLEKSGVVLGCDSKGHPLDANHPWNRRPGGAGGGGV